MSVDQDTANCRTSAIKDVMADNSGAKSLINGLVISQLDYCNALLCGLPRTILNTLHRVQNTAAHIVTRTSHYSHITPVLKDLHWLPIHHRVQVKI